MRENTVAEGCSLENDQSSYISLRAKHGYMDITSPGFMDMKTSRDICVIEIESWNDLEEKILNMFNSRERIEDKHLSIIYQNKLFSRSSSPSSVSISQGSEDEDNMYEEIVQTFSLATQEEAEVVILPDEKTWKRIWKCLKNVLKIKKRG